MSLEYINKGSEGKNSCGRSEELTGSSILFGIDGEKDFRLEYKEDI